MQSCGHGVRYKHLYLTPCHRQSVRILPKQPTDERVTLLVIGRLRRGAVALQVEWAREGAGKYRWLATGVASLEASVDGSGLLRVSKLDYVSKLDAPMSSAF
ncbi:hypothetical protein MRX96_019858 [Rhipicephalus microplus]